MNVLVSGASGLVGSALGPSLEDQGHRVIVLRRSATPCRGAATWDPAGDRVDLAGAGPLDAVVHLAGEAIAQRWTPAVRHRIRRSRVDATRLLATALAGRSSPPAVMISASATGYYGDRGEERLDETSPAGGGFLAEVAQGWEAATAPAREAGVRVVNLRLGVVLSARGGALARMLPVFRAGVGGRLGGGAQYWSWIVLEDLVRVILHCLAHPDLAGAVNAVAPEPVTNREFTRILGRTLRRPTLFRVPEFALRWLLGEMGREALLASARVLPAQLDRSGFEFRFPRLEVALRHLLGSNRASVGGV